MLGIIYQSQATVQQIIPALSTDPRQARKLLNSSGWVIHGDARPPLTIVHQGPGRCLFFTVTG